VKKQMFRVFLSVLFIGFMLIMPAEKTFAAYANSYASIDWSQIVVAWTSQSTSSIATASSGFEEPKVSSDLRLGWVPSSSVANISNASAQGLNSLVALSGTSSAELVGYGWSIGSGSGLLTGSFTANSPGFVVIVVPYTVTLDLLAPDGPTAYSMGRARASLSFTRSGGGVCTDTMELISTIYGGNAFQNEKKSYLGLIRWFDLGDAGTFRAEVTTEAGVSNTVPLPGALLLFAPGLACFFGLRRKFSN
jgi:hypothetical protein